MDVDPQNAGMVIVVIGIAIAVLFAVLALNANGGPSGPSIRPRSLPALAAEAQGLGESLIVRVAGRAYQVTDGDGGVGGETCPWCLGSLDGAAAADVVRCERPFCRQAAHRRHNLEGGGCGGMCSIAGG